MKRLLAFAMIVAVGTFVMGCGGGQTEPKGKPISGGFTTSGDKTKTPAAPSADKKP